MEFYLLNLSEDSEHSHVGFMEIAKLFVAHDVFFIRTI